MFARTVIVLASFARTVIVLASFARTVNILPLSTTSITTDSTVTPLAALTHVLCNMESGRFIVVVFNFKRNDLRILLLLQMGFMRDFECIYRDITLL